jgi:hypothetical protein
MSAARPHLERAVQTLQDQGLPYTEAIDTLQMELETMWLEQLPEQFAFSPRPLRPSPEIQ